MAQIQSGADNTLLTVDPTFKAARTTHRPIQANGWYSICLTSGNLTGLAAANDVFSFQYVSNVSSNLCVVRRVRVGFTCNTGFTTAQPVDLLLFPARAYSVADTGGTNVNWSGANTKHRTTMPQFAGGLADARIASTTGLGNGTRTLDAQPIAQVIAAAPATVGGGVPSTDLFNQDPGDYPLVLANQEGFIIQTGQAWGAAGVVRVDVEVHFAEVMNY